MAVDSFGNYSRSVRIGNRVVRDYLGKGPVALLATILDDQRRTERQARSLAWETREATRVPAEASLLALNELADRMMRATLLAAGYHQHDRGSWRKRRMNGNEATSDKDTFPPKQGLDAIATKPGGEPESAETRPLDPGNLEVKPLTGAEFWEILSRAEQGDKTVLPKLRHLLDSRPDLWRLCGDVARTAEADWIGVIAGPNLLTRESLKRKTAELKAELAGPDAPPVERLLAERVASRWMQASHADSALAGLKGQPATLAQLNFLQQRQERTQRLYLAAIKDLTTVRQLGKAASPVVPTEPANIREKKSRPDSKRQLRANYGGSASTHPVAGGRPEQNDDLNVTRSKTAERQVILPQVLQDRIRGLVGSDE